MIKFYQYVPLIKSKALSRLIPKILFSNANVILDLEDSVQDTLNPEITPLLKESAREGFRFLAEKHHRLFSSKRIGVRINGINTDDYRLDIKEISYISKYVSLDAIWLPMVLDSDTILQCLDDLEQSGVKNIEIIPIIETVDGVNNLEDILALAKEVNINRVHYGHYDYSLDSGKWPFLTQDQDAFWVLVESIINIIEDFECYYIHTPLGELENDELFLSINKKLTGLCQNKIGRTTLNYHQTLLISDNEFITKLDKKISYSENEKINLAHKTITQFELYRINKRSFSISGGKFITPHEYMVAKKYLDNINSSERTGQREINQVRT